MALRGALKKSSESELAAQIRSAIGAAPDEAITIQGPQFERLLSDPTPGSPPSDWDALRSMDSVALKEMGCGKWDEPDTEGRVLMLFPDEWYRHIPGGYRVESISGEMKPFAPGMTDNDICFGCLAYGVRVMK